MRTGRKFHQSPSLLCRRRARLRLAPLTWSLCTGNHFHALFEDEEHKAQRSALPKDTTQQVQPEPTRQPAWDLNLYLCNTPGLSTKHVLIKHCQPSTLLHGAVWKPSFCPHSNLLQAATQHHSPCSFGSITLWWVARFPEISTTPLWRTLGDQKPELFFCLLKEK